MFVIVPYQGTTLSLCQHYTNAAVSLAMLDREADSRELFEYLMTNFKHDDAFPNAQKMYVVLLHKIAAREYNAGRLGLLLYCLSSSQFLVEFKKLLNRSRLRWRLHCRRILLICT